jgi:Holliday junction resolvase RusA-like endonuclease
MSFQHDHIVHLVIPGRPAILKNSKRVISRGAGRRAIVLPSITYVKWEQHAALWLQRSFRGCLIDYQVTAEFRFFFENRKSEPDVSNLIEGPADVMQKVGILKNDRLIVRLTAEKFFGHDPRTEIDLYRRFP